MRQPARRPGDSCPDRHPPQPRRGRAPGAKTDPAMPNPIRNRRRTTIGEQPFGLTKRASRKRPNPCRNLISAGPASSPYDLCGPCSSVPASGCHHRPVPETTALKSRRSGTRKTRTKFALRSQAVAPTTWKPQGPPEPSPMPPLTNCPSPTYRKGADFPMTMTMTTAALPPTARPPPA